MKDFVKGVFVQIHLEDFSVNVHQGLMCPLIGKNVQIMMNAKKQECVRMVFASTWTAVTNVNAKMGSLYRPLVVLVLVNNLILIKKQICIIN